MFPRRLGGCAGVWVRYFDAFIFLYWNTSMRRMTQFRHGYSFIVTKSFNIILYNNNMVGKKSVLWNEDVIEKIKYLRDKGLSYRKIGTVVGFSGVAVFYVCKSLEVRKNEVLPNQKEEEEEQET